MGTYIEIFKLPTLQNGQTHSNNSSAKAVTGCLEDYLLLLISFRMYENFENGVKKGGKRQILFINTALSNLTGCNCQIRT